MILKVFHKIFTKKFLSKVSQESLSLRSHWIPASNKEWLCVRSQKDVAGSCFIICSLKSVSEGGWRYKIIRKSKEKVVEYKCKCKGESYYLKTDFGKQIWTYNELIILDNSRRVTDFKHLRQVSTGRVFNQALSKLHLTLELYFPSARLVSMKFTGNYILKIFSWEFIDTRFTLGKFSSSVSWTGRSNQIFFSQTLVGCYHW